MHSSRKRDWTSYNLNGTRIQSAHVIQKGLYARKRISVQRFPGDLLSHKLPLTAFKKNLVITYCPILASTKPVTAFFNLCSDIFQSWNGLSAICQALKRCYHQSTKMLWLTDCKPCQTMGILTECRVALTMFWHILWTWASCVHGRHTIWLWSVAENVDQYGLAEFP